MALDRHAGSNKRCVKYALIRFQRPEKSESSEGNVQMVCRCSGRITMT